MAPGQSPANRVRGETEIALEGVRYVMRPSFEAVDEFEQATDKAAKELLDAAATDRLKAREIAAVVGACVRAKGRQDGDASVSAFQDDRIRSILSAEPGGLLVANRTLVRMLVLAVTGGVDATGKAKPMPAKSPPTSADTAAGSPGSPPASSAGHPTASGAARRTSSSRRTKAGAKPTPSTSDGWTIRLDGESHPLRVTIEAMLAIEAITGRTLFQHVSDAKARSLPLDTLATILRCLLGPDCAVPELCSPEWVEISEGPRMMLPDEQGNAAAVAVIGRTGPVNVMAMVVIPILYALRGGVTAAGDPLPGFQLEG